MKRLTAIVFSLIIIFNIAGCINEQKQTETTGPVTETEIETDAYYTPVEMKETASVGVLPAEYTRGIIGNRLFTEAVKTGDGYLLPSQYGVKAAVSKYDLQGRLLWKKTIPYMFNISMLGHLIVTEDGGFAFTVSPATNNSTVKTEGNPVVFKCDKNGKVLWSRVYKDFSESALQGIFETESGDIVTIGNYEKSGKDGTIVSKTYISKLSNKGVLLKEAYYDGPYYNSNNDATYIKGVGLAVHINSQSYGGGDFNGCQVLALFNSSLDIVWFKYLDKFNYTYAGYCYFNKAFYVCWSKSPGVESSTSSPFAYTDSKIKKIDTDRTVGWEKEYPGNTVYSYFACPDNIANSNAHIVLSCRGNLLFLDGNGKVQKQLAFDCGQIKKVVEYDDYCLIISENTTGILDSNPLSSYLPMTTELVYTGYDNSGKLIWRKAFDSTQEHFRKYKYISGDKDGVDDFIKKYKDQIGSEYINGDKISADVCFNVTPKTVAEKANCQIFKFSNSYASFLLYEGKVYPLGESFGGYGVVDVVLCDLNKDGNKELLFTYSWGSGLHRSLVGHFDLKTKKQTTLDYTYFDGDMMLVTNWDYSFSLYSATIDMSEITTVDYSITAGKHLGDIIYKNGEIKVMEN